MPLLCLGGLLAFFMLGTAHAQTPKTHTVQTGETVYAIAKKYGTTSEKILQANPGLNPSRIHAGDKILLPSGPSPTPAASPSAPTKTPAPATSSSAPAENSAAQKTWVKIQKGDTLSKLAREHGVKVEDLRQWNRLAGSTIRPGDLLRVRAPGTNNPTAAPKKTPVISSPPRPAEPEDRFIAPVRAQIDAPKNRLRDWEYIVVHHSGTSGGNAKIFDYYHSQERGMENGMAYHFVIGNGTDSGDGEIEVGKRWLRQLQGGHLASETLNEVSIGICLVGDFSRSRLGPRQTAALIELVKYLHKMMPESELKFRLHREINTRPTECPGRLFPGKALHEILR
ncbi:MAG: LysM peptidoglycan-binding domain-containing protein [Verrucomicrobia bacterium]|nr:LysM peptidoglycan-binding domain-containing protein [Verrucomicrobiota bacterium]